MTHRARRATFRIVYIAPTLVLQTIRITRDAPTVGDPTAVFAVVVGGFAFSLLVGTTLLPLVLRRHGREDLAAQWRRAAFCGLDFPALWIPLWTGIYVHAWPLGVQLLLGVATSIVLLSILSWVDRRWLHYGILRRK